MGSAGHASINLLPSPEIGFVMIYSDRQQEVSVKQLEKMRAALSVAEAVEPETDWEPDWIREIHINAAKSEIAIMEADLAHYENLKSGAVTLAEATSLGELPSVLVQARIAAGLSQSEFAERLGIGHKQVQRFEDSNYENASLNLLVNVCEVLDVRATGHFNLKGW